MTSVTNASGPDRGEWRVVVDSIGNAGAPIVQALKQVSPMSESRLAELLYQAPSELLTDLDRESAEKVNDLLVSAGLDSRILDAEDDFEPGDSDHELALVVHDFGRMMEVTRLVVELVGVSIEQARKLLCASPAVLVGRVSANTAAAIEARFAALGGVEVDVSRASEAVFDVFLGECSEADRARVAQELRSVGLAGEESAELPLLASSLPKAEAERLWQRLGRSGLPLRIVNRDFARFDVRLEAAPDTPEMIDFLTATTGMPEKVARRVVSETPIVIHQNVSFEQLAGLLERLRMLGAVGSGQLLLFQSFALEISKLGDLAGSVRILQALTDLGPRQAEKALRTNKRVGGPLTQPQARWLQWELRAAGTESELMLR